MTTTPTETSLSAPEIDRTIPLTMNKCQVCKEQIRTMCFLGTGVCGTNCQKVRDDS